jgi:uncharacterized protein (TIGR02266 family)
MVAVKTVLIADDTAFVRDRFRTALEGAGHRAVTVRTGQELLSTLRSPQQRIDLVVLDLRLPNGRGIDLVRSLRKVAPETPPVVVFSGTIANAEEVRDLASFGVAGYVNEYTGVGHIMPALAPHLFPENYNRRSSPRVVLGVPITYRVGNAIFTSLTLNISHGGVAVRTTNPLDVASVVRLKFRMPGTKKDIDAEARVAWSDRRVGMGLQFISLDPRTGADRQLHSGELLLESQSVELAESPEDTVSHGDTVISETSVTSSATTGARLPRR